MLNKFKNLFKKKKKSIETIVVVCADEMIDINYIEMIGIGKVSKGFKFSNTYMLKYNKKTKEYIKELFNENVQTDSLVCIKTIEQMINDHMKYEKDGITIKPIRK